MLIGLTTLKRYCTATQIVFFDKWIFEDVKKAKISGYLMIFVENSNLFFKFLNLSLNCNLKNAMLNQNWIK